MKNIKLKFFYFFYFSASISAQIQKTPFNPRPFNNNKFKQLKTNWRLPTVIGLLRVLPVEIIINKVDYIMDIELDDENKKYMEKKK